ncbi:MAG: gamma-glutamyltransferase [Kiloniellales bacterium]
MRNLHLPGRSPVHATNGMAATSSPLASSTAIDVLRSGGNAMDAAVAACAVLCVVEPGSTGVGGDCFTLYSPHGEGVIAYNGSGRAPAAATPEWYAERGIREIERNTPHAVSVPGAVEAWCRLIADHGTKDLAELLAPAIRYARDGYPIHSRVAVDFAQAEELLAGDANAAATFLPGGRPPSEGELHYQPRLADTLERIAREGRDGFYRGPVADDIVGYLKGLGGLHSLEDFTATKGDYVTPIGTAYRGCEVLECPPNCHGVTALEIMNILAELDVGGLDPLSVDRFHLQIEATRVAYRDRADFVADPERAEIPVERLLSRAYARDRAAAIRDRKGSSRSAAFGVPAHSDTVYLCVVDRDRNAVSFINSLYSVFGSGLCAPMSGVMLQDRARGFVLTPGHPNCIAPGKRPLHTLLPGMLVEGGRAVMPFGVMGGLYQAVGHAHLVSNLLDYGLDIQEAIDLPRVFATPDGPVEVEDGVPKPTVSGLHKLGHETVRPAKPIGGGQAIRIDWQRGVLTGGSDPRKDGCALGY